MKTIVGKFTVTTTLKNADIERLMTVIQNTFDEFEVTLLEAIVDEEPIVSIHEVYVRPANDDEENYYKTVKENM